MGGVRMISRGDVTDRTRDARVTSAVTCVCRRLPLLKSHSLSSQSGFTLGTLSHVRNVFRRQCTFHHVAGWWLVGSNTPAPRLNTTHARMDALHPPFLPFPHSGASANGSIGAIGMLRLRSPASGNLVVVGAVRATGEVTVFFAPIRIMVRASSERCLIPRASSACRSTSMCVVARLGALLAPFASIGGAISAIEAVGSCAALTDALRACWYSLCSAMSIRSYLPRGTKGGEMGRACQGR